MEYRVVVNQYGDTQWYKPGTDDLHREDGPAIEYADGTKLWYKDGDYHRENGPACEYADGTKSWYKDGELHREDGPAIEHVDGNKFWHKDGELHREDGPAIEYSNGYKAWYLDNVQMTEEEFLAKTQPAKELTVAELENLLGYKIKIKVVK